MKAAELRDKTPDQLRQTLIDLKKEQFNMRFRAVTGEMGNTSQFRKVRRDVARVKTILSEKVQAAAKSDAE